ncbi:cyclin-dependent kinase 12-like isoform X2 [Echeneis naucrates]|uniref:cyclin-dependent kinase 12-like isoform X2 n=1 Tax=Echeneis naucrates TaxID=173247 RepID=UPI001114099A|nr:cyclin-dependent kinase 12-like isoform X2 [Echeneis naucrates]
MYSSRSEHSHRRQYSERGSRQWDDCDRWEERHGAHRDGMGDSFQKYGRDGRGSRERTNRSRELSDSPNRWHSKDSLSREWKRRSPARRHMPSPDWGTAGRKRQRISEDDEDDYGSRREDKTYRHSQDSFSHFKHTRIQEEDCKFRKTSQESRHRRRHEEETYRPMSGHYKDGKSLEKSWECSEERTRSQEFSMKSRYKPRELDGSPSTDYEGHLEDRARFPLNESSGQSFESDVPNQSPTVPMEKSTRGFQRFLDVLNKGVNVAMLTKIVTQTSTKVSDQPCSSGSAADTADCPWSLSSAKKQQEKHDNCHVDETDGAWSLASPQGHHRSYSPLGCPPSDEKSLQRCDEGQSYDCSNSRSRSPSVVRKITLTPEDEHKHRQMQDVLQAIGMDLGSEELGQMTHRIQERLYGKKDNERGRHNLERRARDLRQACSPRRQSRSSSSSSRSNFSSLTRDSNLKNDSCNAQRDETEVDQVHVHQTVEYGQNGSSSFLQDSEKCESEESTAALQTFTPNTTCSLSEPPPKSVMPTYLPMNCLPPQYQTPPPALPPNFPHAAPSLFLPHLPPFLPYPHIPSLNIIPAALTQTMHLFPQTVSNQTSLFNLPNLNPVPSLNTTQKSKTQSRPRCLQVIETKQPG